MNKRILTALVLSLAFLPLAGSAYAQCSPNSISCVPSRPGGNPQTPTTDPTGVPLPTVCFYMGENFKGPYFCEIGTRSVATVSAQWRNKIQSIKVGDQTAVRVCPSDMLQGECDLLDKDTKKLQPGLFKHVRSYDIRQTY